MQKFTADDPETKSADVVADNLEALKALFPDAFTEGKIDFNVLKQLLGGAVDQSDEKYGLTWHGKRAARQLALTPSTGTLRPCPEESVDWDTTQNLMIEGDNLEVLKLLQKSYMGKVDVVYIDPPYNTGKDFIYPDNFRDPVGEYLRLTGQVDEAGSELSSNSESSGRYHSTWLDMIYPRLRVARNLLALSGALMMSIGDEEVASAIQILDDIFGEENASAHFTIIRSEGGGLAKQVVKGHDHLLVYARDIRAFSPLRRPKDVRGKLVTVDGDEYWLEEDWLRRKFGQYGTCEYGEIEEYLGAAKKAEVDSGLESGEYQLVHKRDGRVVVGRLRRLDEDASKFYSVQKHLNAGAADDLEAIGMPAVFDFPKPVSLIADVVLGATFYSKNDAPIVMDFFAGSGTTAHAVMQRNAGDGGNRRFILVQLPEVLDPSNKSQAAASKLCESLGAASSIAELTKERLRRAGVAIAGSSGPVSADLDVGFRVFKLDSSNIETWEPDRESLSESLTDAIEHLKGERSEDDILYELLLKLGLELTVPIETREIAGKTVYNVGAGTLLVCLAESIDLGDAEALGLEIAGWHAELDSAGDATVVFRDSAFADDVAKTNLTAILEQHGLSTVRSL